MSMVTLNMATSCTFHRTRIRSFALVLTFAPVILSHSWSGSV